MMKVVINPTWMCQLSCAYCWMPHVAIDRSSESLPPKAWGKFLESLPAPSVVDISGGEPTLYEDIWGLIRAIVHSGHYWAITTNAMKRGTVEGFLNLSQTERSRCAAINVSAHEGNMEQSASAISELRQAGFQVNPNGVKHEHGVEVEGPRATNITYQPWAEGTAVDGRTYECDAGRNHWVADPSGRIYRCAVAMQVGKEPIGNVKTGITEDVSQPFVCDYGCSSCYADPREWRLCRKVLG